MPSKHNMMQLGMLCQVLSGTTPDTNNPVYWQGPLPWVTPAEITEDSSIVFYTNRTISKEAVKKNALPLLPKGTVLLSSRAPIGKVAIAGIDMYCNQGFKNLVCSDKIYNKYLYFFLKSKTKFLNSLGRGATFKEISKSIVENILIPCPDIQIQKQIAERLDKVQELIAKQKEQIAKLDLLIKSRFFDMFGDPIGNPKKWPGQSLSNVAPKKSRKVAVVGSSVWLLNLDQIEANSGRVIKKERFDFSQLGNSIFPFYSGEVLYSKLRPYLNKVVLADEDGFCTTELLPLHPQKEICNALFLAHLLRQQSVVTVLSMRVIGTKMPRVDLATLKNLLIILPPLSLQTQFANFVKSVERQKEVFSSRLSHLETLYKSLMQEYFG